MRRVILASLILIAFAWISGCSNSNSSSSGSGTTTQSPALLNGQYGFSMSGFDSLANPMSMAGSFKADGAGHITAGDVDVNDPNNGGVSSSTALTGTYSFDSSGQGILGTIVLTNTVGSVTHPLAFGFALNAAGGFGDIISLDTNNFIIAGTMQQQSSSVFTLAGLAGSYIVTVNGRSGGNPTSALGRFTLASNGTTTNVSFDRSIAGIGTAGPTTGTSAVVVFSSTAPDANGRGTFTVALNDGLVTAATQTFAYYAINATRFVAVEIDNVGTLIVDGSSQATIPATVATTGSVFGIAGVDTSTSAEISAVGQIVITGATGTGGTLAWNSNDNGGIFNTPTLAGQAVAYNAATGRGTIAIASGVTNGLANSLVFYLTAPGTGFIMDSTTGTTNRAMGGTLTAQTGTSFSTATDLAGLAEVRSKGTTTADAQAIIGAFGLTSTAGTYALLADQRFPSGTTIQTLTDANISGITIASLSATTGGGTMLVAGSAVETLAFYVIGPNQFVFIDISPVGNANNGATSLFFATPD